MNARFAQTGPAVVTIRDVRRFRIEGGKASLRVELEAAPADKKDVPPDKFVLDLECIRGSDRWMIWREDIAQIALAARLAELKTKAEREALLQAEGELKSPSLCRALVWRGDRLDGQADHSRARELYELALAMAREIGDRGNEAAALSGVADTLASTGELGRALELAKQSLDLREQVGEKAAIATGLVRLGFVYRLRDELDPALECYRKGLSIRSELGNKPGVASIHREIGLVYYLQRDYLAAIDHYSRSLEIYEDTQNRAETAQTLYNTGVVHRALGDFDRALDSYQRSLLIRQETGDRAGAAACFYSMANVHAARGNYAKALEYYQKQMEIDKASGDGLGVATALSGMASVYNGQGHPERALAGYQESLALYRAAGRKRLIASALNNVAVSRTIIGDHARALDDYAQSLALYEELKDRDGIARCLLNIGTVEVRRKDPARALASLVRSLSLWEELGDKQGAALTLAWLASAHCAVGSCDRAVAFATRSADTARAIGAQAILWKASAILGESHRALRQTGKAREGFEEAIRAIEGLRHEVAGGESERAGFLADKVSPYHGMVGLEVDRSRDAEALSYAEQAKGRVLLEVLVNGRENIDAALSDREREEERKRATAVVSLRDQLSLESRRRDPDRNRIAGLKADLEKARLEREAFETNAYAAHPELRVQRGELPMLTAGEAARLLPGPAGVLLEFVVTEARTFLLVVARSGTDEAGGATVRAYPIAIGREDLVRRVERFRKQIADRDLGFRASAAGVFDLLLGPARSQLEGCTSVVIVPDGPLWDLPFQALVHDGKYLWQKCDISYAPSLAVLREMTELHRKRAAGRAGPTSLLAMGNPSKGQPAGTGPATLDGGSMPSLPEAEDQVMRIGRLYGHRAKVYVGGEASEGRFKKEAGSFSVVHLATHGVLVDTNPLYSHVIMSHGSEDDGELEAREILRLRLNADLVVLSACETARGRAGAGEGMIGLSWALFVAGCPTAVVSQWKVDAAATTDLMVEFHRLLQAARPGGRHSKAAALRQAALVVMRDPRFRHPFYWAGFILVGDGS